MRKQLMALITLATCIGLTSCRPRGIKELSVEDTQRCYQVLAKEDALFSKVVSALDEFTAAGPDKQADLLRAHKECKEYIGEADQFVKQMYEKYNLTEDEYRLDVFTGRFMPKRR